MLIDYYNDNNNHNYDFIWGMAFHELNNLDMWLKRRELFNDIFGVYYTIQLFNKPIKNLSKTNFYYFYEENKISLIDAIDERIPENISKNEENNLMNNLFKDFNKFFNKNEFRKIFTFVINNI